MISYTHMIQGKKTYYGSGKRVLQQEYDGTVQHSSHGITDFINLPSPELLQEYELLTPGAAEQILQIVYQQRKHQRQLEKFKHWSDFALQALVCIFVFIAGMVVLKNAINLYIGSHLYLALFLLLSYMSVVIAWLVRQKSSWQKAFKQPQPVPNAPKMPREEKKHAPAGHKYKKRRKF